MQRGFTLIEIVITLAVLILLGAAALTSFQRSRSVRDLTSEGQNVLSILRLAQGKTLAGEANASWGVHLATTTYVLFQGNSFATATATQTFLLPSHLEVADVALAGGSTDVVFTRLEGSTAQSGTFELRLTGDPAVHFPIVVEQSGKVYQATTIPAPTGSRIADARHRAFSLSWSIQNSTSLILTFSDPPNPDTVQTIAMAPYFNADKSRFDWSGTVAVGGQNQVLRIHTTLLTPSNTNLSVDRDCRDNTKKLAIAIDTSQVATYEADCVTVTVGAQGGVVSEP